MFETSASRPSVMTPLSWAIIGGMVVVALYFVLRPYFDRTRQKPPLVIVIGVPVFAAAAYALLFSPKPAGEPPPSVSARPVSTDAATGNDGKIDSVSNLVDGLAARLAENPEDGKGWLLLAQSYEHLGRTTEALEAYEKAKALGQFSATLDALAPGAGTKTAAANSGALIRGTVSLASEREAAVRPTDTVFIFAREPGAKGPPAAVLRVPADKWPIEFSLSDADSMVEGLSLSNYAKVVVTARVSRSGNAAEAMPGMEAVSGAIDVGSGATVELVIR